MLPRLSHAAKGSSVAQNQQRMRARPTSCWSWLTSCSDGDSGNEDNKEAIIQQLCDEFQKSKDNLLINELFEYENDENGEKAVKSKDDLIQRVGNKMIKAALSKQLPPKNVEGSLKMPGIYVYHVKCLTVQFVPEPEPEPESEPEPEPEPEWMKQDWCVVKVGKTDGPIGSRLSDEFKEINNMWRWHETKTTPMNISNEDIVACFSGAAWVGSEGNIRNRLGLPLGKGQLVSENNDGLNAMEEEYKKNGYKKLKIKTQGANQGAHKGDGIITVSGWSMFFHPAKKANSTKNGLGSTIGPSELIIMRKDDMLQLRRSFKAARFLSTFPGTNVDAETGPAWDSINKISLPDPGTWHGKPVMVGFERDDLIAPLKLSLWDVEEAKRTKPKGTPGRNPKFNVGDNVEVYIKKAWRSAKVVKFQGGKYCINCVDDKKVVRNEENVPVRHIRAKQEG